MGEDSEVWPKKRVLSREDQTGQIVIKEDHPDREVTKIIKTKKIAKVVHYQLMYEIYQEHLISDLNPKFTLAEKICIPYMLEFNLHVTPIKIFCHKLV